MNKTFYYIFAILLTLAVSGCDDYLTQTPPDQLTSKNYWRSQADVLFSYFAPPKTDFMVS